MSPSLIFCGCILLLHDESDHVNPIRADLLIEGSNITQIGQGITADASVTVIDCKDKIVSPGFIDTHHHLWQTQLKGRHANETLLDYMTSGECSSARISEID